MEAGGGTTFEWTGSFEGGTMLEVDGFHLLKPPSLMPRPCSGGSVDGAKNRADTWNHQIGSDLNLNSGT